MLAFALTSLLLSQAGETHAPIGVVLTSRRPNTDVFAPKIAAKVVEVLKREGVAEVSCFALRKVPRYQSASPLRTRASAWSAPRLSSTSNNCVGAGSPLSVW